MWEQVKQWDRDLFVYLNSLGIESNDNFWIFVTNPTHWIWLYVVIFLVYLYVFHWRKAVFTYLYMLAAFLVTYGITNLVKGLATRLRPNNNPDLVDIIRVLKTPTNYSFFSGHASSSFVITTFVVLTLRDKTRWVYLMYIWPVLFSLSRIYVGVHYPGDVTVGALVGILIAYIFFRFYDRSGKHFNLF